MVGMNGLNKEFIPESLHDRVQLLEQKKASKSGGFQQLKDKTYKCDFCGNIIAAINEMKKHIKDFFTN